MTRGHLSSDRPAADLAPLPTGPAPGAERPWLAHEGCEGRIHDDGERIAELEAEVERLREVARIADDISGMPDCPWCEAVLPDDCARLRHEDDCQVGRIIDGLIAYLAGGPS